MADVFSQLYIHLVFSPKNRKSLIHPSWEERLHKYITGVVQERGHKMLAIGGMPDHIHIFVGLKPSESISELVKEIKNASNDFVKKEKLATENLIGKTATAPSLTAVRTLTLSVSTFFIKKNTIKRGPFGKSF